MTVHIHGKEIITGDVDYRGFYAIQLQNIAALAAKGPGYYFRGGSDYIAIADHANLSFGNGTTDKAFSVVARISPEDATSFPVIGKGVYNTSGEWRLLIDSADKINFQLFDAILSDCYIGRKYNTALTNYEGKHLDIVATYDGSGASSGIKIYIGGARVDDADAENSAAGYTAMDNLAADMHICRDDTTYGKGHGFEYYIFNLELPLGEAEAISSGAPVLYKYIGASQTELMPNEVDRDFSGPAAWADVDLNAFDELWDLTITADTAAQYCTLLVASAPTTIGKRYRMTYDLANIVSTWILKSFDGTQTIGIISANATQASIEWTATTTGGYRLVAVANDSSGDFDNFTLTQIGCVPQLEQDGIGHNQWIDISGNELYGTVSDAIPTNLPANHIERYVKKAVTGETTITAPTGYAFVGIAWENTTANQAGNVNFGWSDDGQEIVADINLAGNTIGTLTLLKRIAVLTPGSMDNVYISSDNWNGSSIDFYITYERLT